MIVFADKQDITRVGLIHVADSLSEAPQYRSVEDKATLIETLNEESDAVVYLDYTMFDINDVAELQIIAQRFPNALWVLFCDELSYEFINQTVANNRQFGIVMKDSPLYEIRESMMYALRHQRFICQRIAEMLLNPPVVDDMSPAIACLTKTETELWKEPEDPVLEKIKELVTETTPEWAGTATELVEVLQVEMQPNALSRKLNVSLERLILEYGIQYKTERGHDGRKIRLAFVGKQA